MSMMQRGRKTKHTSIQVEPSADDSQLQAVVSLLTKPKGGEKEIQQLRKKVANDRRTLDALLHQRLDRAEKNHARRRNEMSALIVQALTKPNKTSSRRSTVFPNTKIAGNGIYDSAIKIDTARRNTISIYEGLENTIARLGDEDTNKLMEKWTKDMAEMERLLKLGHRTAVRQVQKVVGAETQGDEAKMEESGIGVRAELNMELLRGLRYAERGVKRMAKGIPKDAP